MFKNVNIKRSNFLNYDTMAIKDILPNNKSSQNIDTTLNIIER